jgi:ubiquinone/menaquinone biosynthesis C-methylase UbiE
MNETSRESSFADVDSSVDPQLFVHCLEEQYAKNSLLRLNKARALEELIRVTKPGGKIIIAEPDHDSLIIDTPFVDVNHRFMRFRSDQMAQGSIAHQLYNMFKELGLESVSIEPLTRAYTNYEEKKVSSPYLEEIWMAQEQGVVTKEEAENWTAYLRDAVENDRFLCLQTYVITTGFKHV